MADSPEVLSAIRELEKKVGVMAQALTMTCDGLTKMQTVLDEVHKACTADRPKSELKPILERIEKSCSETCDAVLELPELIHDAVSVAVGGVLNADPG